MAEEYPQESQVSTAPAPSIGVWTRIKDHKIAQWTLAYAAAAYALLDGTKILSEAFDWPHWLLRAVAALLVLGLPLMVTLAWYHGYRALRRVSGAELTIITVLLVLAGAVLWHFARAPQEPSAPRAATPGLVTSAATNPVTGTPAAAISNKSIAVLPFVDMSEKHDQEYFSDGLSEELIDMLTKVPDLKVPARTSSFYFKGKPTPIKDIAAALGVAHVLEGSVRTSGKHMRITVQLIRVTDGFHFWSHTYDRELDDIFKLQDEIAGAVVTALKSSLADGSGLRLSTTHNSEAFAHYLQARDIFRGLSTLGGIDQAADHLRAAVRLDPGFTMGWATLAAVLESEVIFGERHSDIGILTEMRAANQRALALGPQIGFVQLVNADIQARIDWDWAGAALSMKKAYDADSTDPDNCAGLATALFTLGQNDKTSIDLLKKAIALDPLNSDNYNSLGDQYFVLGRLSEAEAALREAVRLDPSGIDSNNSLGSVLIAEGKAKDALAIYQSKLPSGMRLRGTAIAYFELGREGEAKAALDELERNYATRFAYSIAKLHARRQEIDAAFSWLERAYALHDSALPNVNRDPWFRNLRHDKRWREFLRKMNLPEIPNR
jgi:adenylate cyclase